MMEQTKDNVLGQFGKGKKTELKKGGRAVIYQRVSSKEQEFGFSPEVQMDVCHKWAESHGYKVEKTFEGEHESAKSDVNRKRFNSMLKFVEDKKNKIDAVIVYSTSRFSRTGAKGALTIVEELQQRGITVFSATSNYDARTPEGEWMQGVEFVNARHDNAVKGRAVRDAGEKALRKGRWIQAPPRGYDMKTTRAQQTITVNADGELIRKAFALKVNENLTNEEVRVRMKAMGLDLDKQRWSSIFHNIFYAGYFAHPFLQGDVIKGPHEPLVSLDDFLKVNNIILKSHTRGYETKTDKAYAPLLGVIRCPHCGHNLTASLSTKMRKRFGKDIGYYVCSRKGCKCNASTKKVNEAFEGWLATLSFPHRELLEAQLAKTLPVLNKNSKDEVASIKVNLTKKENEIERIEYNLATAPTPKIQETCSRMLAKAEAERDEILRELEDKDKSILNLDDYVQNGLTLRDNMLKLWQIANLGHKRQLQNLVFPDGIVWNKETDDIEPLSKNEFLFTWGLKSGSYGEKENGQTADFDNLSALAPPRGLEPRTP